MKKFVPLVLAGLIWATLVAPAQAERYARTWDSGTVRARGGMSAPPPVRAPYGQPYFFGHLGIFEPNGDSQGLDGFDSGVNFDIGVGSNVSANLAVEGTIGTYYAKGTGRRVTVVPATVGVRVILPTGTLEPYAGAGLGLYYADVELPSRDDSDLAIGGYGSVGVDAWMTSRAALNIELKYHLAEPKIQGTDMTVRGLMLNIGVRFAF